MHTHGYASAPAVICSHFRSFSHPCQIPRLKGKRASAIAAGTGFGLAVVSGIVWSCGSHLANGHADGKLRPSPERIEMLSGLEVVEVGAGDSYAVALDSQGAFSSENWAADLSCLPSFRCPCPRCTYAGTVAKARERFMQ